MIQKLLTFTIVTIVVTFVLVFTGIAQSELIHFEDFEDYSGFTLGGGYAHSWIYWGIAPLSGTPSVPSNFVQGGSQSGNIFYGSFAKASAAGGPEEPTPTITIILPDLTGYSNLQLTVSLAAPEGIWEPTHRDSLHIIGGTTTTPPSVDCSTAGCLPVTGAIDSFLPLAYPDSLQSQVHSTNLQLVFQDFTYSIDSSLKSITLAFASTAAVEVIGIDSVKIKGEKLKKIGVFRNGRWYLDYNGNGAWDNCTTDRCYNFGASNDTPVVGDWNGDGWTEIGVKRGNKWYLDYNSSGFWDGCAIDRCYLFGVSTDLSVIGDWDNDGTDEIGVFRNGSWYLDLNGNGKWQNCRDDLCASFGTSTDIPLAGHWSGMATYALLGVFRNGYWYLDHDLNDYWDGCVLDICYSFGRSTDTPVVGDWNGDENTEIGVKRANKWYLDYNGNGAWNNCTTDRCYIFGAHTDKPVVGNW